MYDATSVEEKWLSRWKERNLSLFDEKDASRELFIIDTPPPFTNGALHMGQVFWVSYIDSIARYMRLKGLNVLYPQGWDVHGFPTELAVEKQYGKGLAREEFYKRAIEVSNVNIASMKARMQRLGASFDERYEYSTLSKGYMAKVQLALLKMYENGMVYRAAHPVPWCTSCGTSISREQAEEAEKDTTLNHVEFKAEGSVDGIVIATSRPEMLHACVALAVNPKDGRYSGMVGKKAVLPIFGRGVDIIGDDSVDMGFGTGAEMVCTFGDKDDIKMYYRHKLRLIVAMDEAGKLKNAGRFDGLDVKAARKAVLEALNASGALKKQERIKHTVKIHDRCKTESELLSYLQWFIKVKDIAGEIKSAADGIRWFPDFTKHRFMDWANSVEWDWNISRRRIFGTPIPFWYCTSCGEIVAPPADRLPVNPATEGPVQSKCQKCGGELHGETDTCDGWVDTCITPLAISGWPDNKALLDRGFPTALRIQGVDIIRTWAFYTVTGTLMVAGKKPWKSIIAHGMILGEDGREMHKSWGNGVYPDELMQKYSSDAIRMWVALSGGLGKDKPFSYKELEHAKGFTTKLYNSAIFVSKLLEKNALPREAPQEHMGVFDIWILARLNQVVKEVRDSYDQFMLYEAMTNLVNFYWHEFADYYIENVKYRAYSEEKGMEGSKAAALFTLRYVLLNSVRLMAPVIPFVCEEVNAMFSPDSVFGGRLPAYGEPKAGSEYFIDGRAFQGAGGFDYGRTGAFINGIIAEVRKEKARGRIALNKEIASININVPEEYNSAVSAAKEEIRQICKAKAVKLVSTQKELSVSIDI